MVRKLSLMLVLTLGLVPFVAQALGLGDIKLNSALNQEFDAEIQLLSLAKGEIHDVKVTMASDKAFKRSGVDRTFLLTTLIFKTEQKADGTSVVRVISKNPIREPFLNFLIEVNWPKGRLIREYTVLLDPPVTLKRKPAPIQAPVVTQKPVAPVPAKAAPAIEQAPVSDTPIVGSVGEVKVQNNQSLWVIARKHQHQGVDHTRMMMAIYRANPQAFYKSNINRLKKGAILRIPEKNDVLELDVREAQREYKQHVEEWQADRLGTKKSAEPKITENSEQTSEDTKAEEKAAEEQKTEAEPKEEKGQVAEEESKEEKQADAELKAEEEQKAEAEKKTPAAEEAKSEAEEAQEAKTKENKTTPEAELKIATARPEGKGEAGPSEDGQSEDTVARLKQELLILEEGAESVKGENEELSSRVTDLEDQVNDLERILELKNKQFAALQAALAKSKKEQILLAESQEQQESEAAEKTEPTTTPEMKQPETESAKEEKQPETESAKEEKKPETEFAKEEKQPQADAVKAEEKPVVAKIEEKQPKSVVKPLPKVEKKPVKVVSATPKEESSLLGAIISSPTLLGIVLAVIMILIGLVWILLSRKRTNTADFQESILLNTIDEDVDSSVLDEANNIPAHTEETSFLSDFSPSDIDALQDETGEVDPLSEADVYIAYGRYQQAEELIRQAIDKEPERDALKHKLFEILYATKDSDGFVNLVEESSNTTVETRDSDAWNRILSMGKMLLPKHPKFANAAEIEADDDLFSLDDDLLEEDLGGSDFADLDETLTHAEFGAGDDVKKTDAGQSPESNDELDVDDLLDVSSDLDDTGVGLEDLDFDTNMDDDFISAALDELEELDDSLGIEETEKDQVSSKDESEDEFTLTLSDLEDEGEKTILSLQDELNEEDADLESDSIEDLDKVLANELEDTSLDVPDMEPEEGDSELVSLGELDVDLSINENTPDEISTKLDLARAYIEMGDKEGATDILDEVLSEGDTAQKDAAQKIKDSIA